MVKKKFYVVWEGVRPGIYTSWEDCRLQVTGYSGARYRSFDSFEAAREACESGRPSFGKEPAKRPLHSVREASAPVPFIRESLAVDAACSGNPGNMEYRGVHVATGKEWFHVGPLKQGTNNIGEFLALVHGLALMKRELLALPLYSDSRNAILWVRIKQCRTGLVRTAANVPVFDLIGRAEKWLRENAFQTQILKWNTRAWGEIPADFGRK
ncbi:MAG: ribonuclease H family protein [Tannerella sp.]|jgi:ribonuclease HI|nr:ribonuclease H family protein [Tannerella sp.]